MDEVKFYPSKRGEYPVKDFIEKLDLKSQAKVYSYLTLLKEQGSRLGGPYADKLKGQMRYLRIRTTAGYIRIFYFSPGRNAVLLHAFKKKTPKMPKKEIEIAEKRILDFITRNKRGEFDEKKTSNIG